MKEAFVHVKRCFVTLHAYSVVETEHIFDALYVLTEEEQETTAFARKRLPGCVEM
jgi:hypothetical protein